MAENTNTTRLSWDWKSCPSFEALVDTLTPLGIHVYKDPFYEGTDSYGYIFSRTELLPEELQQMSDDLL